jgi:hypothetical protein
MLKSFPPYFLITRTYCPENVFPLKHNHDWAVELEAEIMAIIRIITFIRELRLYKITNIFCPSGIFTIGLFHPSSTYAKSY